MLGQLLSLIPAFFAPNGLLDPSEPDLLPQTVEGLQLAHCVLEDGRMFSVNEQARQEADVVGARLRTRPQSVPRFLPHTSLEQVELSWQAAMAKAHPDRVPVNSDGDLVDVGKIDADRSDAAQWRIERENVPDVRDKETVLTLAKIAANAYVPVPHEGDWSEVNDSGWAHEGDGFGWDDDQLRGYVFTSPDRSTMVISIKGTSTGVWNDGGPTAPNDKINDNLLFSCCCARLSRNWNTCCDCYLGSNQCDEICLESELFRSDRYYRLALRLYTDARKLVPEASTVWMTGHSLGGALSALVARTYGVPAVSFEAPGEELARRRLHLPAPPGLPPWEDHVWHFGHTADPIFMGTCNGLSSSCGSKGYAMESRCHSGLSCVFDTKKDLGWYESIINHKIHVVIDNVLEEYDEMAECLPSDECADCEKWEFLDMYDTEPKLPTSEASSTTTTGAKTTTTGKEPTTTSSSTKPTEPTKPTKTKPAPTSPTLTSSCIEHNWYGGCKSYTTITVPASSTSAHTTTPPATSPAASSSCLERNWYGACRSWTTVKECVHTNLIGHCDRWRF